MQGVCLLRAFAFDNAGNNMAARIAMIAITTSSSIKVKPPLRAFVIDFFRQSVDGMLQLKVRIADCPCKLFRFPRRGRERKDSLLAAYFLLGLGFKTKHFLEKVPSWSKIRPDARSKRS